MSGSRESGSIGGPAGGARIAPGGAEGGAGDDGAGASEIGAAEIGAMGEVSGGSGIAASGAAEPAAASRSGGAAAFDRDPRAELEALARGLRAAARRRRLLGRRRVPAAPCAAPEVEVRPAAGHRLAQVELGRGAKVEPGAAPGPGARPRAVAAGPSAAGGAAAAPALLPRAPAPRSPALAAAEAAARGIREKAAACPDLESLRAAVALCTACSLCRTRTQTVFSDGSARVRVMFVGEAPGESEDEKGVPFVGRAGALLSDIITKGMGLAREDVFIANVLKCRPPGNRDPSEAEKALCTPWLDRQIELANPAVIIPLGKHAANHVLGTQASMGALRGRVHERGGRKIVPTYHPAYLLRSPGMKKECWRDIQLAMGILGLPRSPRAR